MRYNRIVTWFSPATVEGEEGKVYDALSPRSSGDYPIESRPADIPAKQAHYNPKENRWERVYETADEATEITIGEAEALWQEAQQGSVTASVLLKLLEL